MEKRAYLAIENIKKSFGGVSVLKGVTFHVEKGEVHGLLGGNGAGKSTLMNILGGIYTKDSGEIYIDGELVDVSNTKKADEAGIGFVHQELKLFDLRSVAENILMSRLPSGALPGFVSDKKKNEQAQQWLEAVGLKIPSTTILGELSLAEQQLVEIAKVLSLNAKIIILDEPTSSLTGPETKRLFDIIRKLKNEGACIIYISHKFDEIFEICDKVTVLRDGEVAGTRKTDETTNEQLVSMVIGRRLDQYFPALPAAPGADSEPVLAIKGFSNSKLSDVSFELRKGEILGLFGLVGAGRSELMRAIYGLDYLKSGELYIHEKKVKIRGPRTAMRQGISFLTENRREEGLVTKANVRDNLVLPILKTISVPVVGQIRRKREKEIVDDAFEKFMIKAESPKQRVSRLSGGNQQKVVLSKWFMTNSPILMLDEPTRGVDVGAKAEIYDLIVKNVQEKGLSVILVSSEAPEIMGMCHRILAMRDGMVVGEFLQGETSEEELILKCAGGDR